MVLKIKDKIKIFFRTILIKIVRFFIRGYGLSKIALFRKIFLRIHSLFEGPGYLIPVGEFKIYLDEKDTLGLSLGRIHEQHITELVKKTIKKEDVVVDLGANIGYFTLIFSKLVGPKGKVFAFEPDPTNFAILRENVLINKCSNVILIQKAVSKISEEGIMYLSENNKGDHRIFDSGDNRKKITIETISLDDYFKDSSRINFVKMDIQGSEILALRGMKEILEKNKKHIKILAEFWPNGLKKAGANPKDFFNILKKYNFIFFENREIDYDLIPIKNIDSFINNYSNSEESAASVFAIQAKQSI